MGSSNAMSCLEAARLIDGYIDGEIDEATCAKIVYHLEICRECGMEAELYMQIKIAVGRHRTSVSAESLAKLREYARGLVGEATDHRPPN